LERYPLFPVIFFGSVLQLSRPLLFVNCTERRRTQSGTRIVDIPVIAKGRERSEIIPVGERYRLEASIVFSWF
jgi:hypothetical protein